MTFTTKQPDERHGLDLSAKNVEKQLYNFNPLFISAGTSIEISCLNIITKYHGYWRNN